MDSTYEFRFDTSTGTSTTPMVIRPATDQDWPHIYPFFSSIVADGRTYAYPENLSMEEGRLLWMEQAPGLTVDAVDSDTIMGSAKMVPNRPGRGSHVATGSFMVDPRHRAKGVGRALGLYVVDWARTAGYHSIQFNAVVETNTAAINLWQSLGFEIIATVPEAFAHSEHGYVGLHLMFRRL